MYKDRGIIKWAPFDALVGFHGKLADMLYNKYKKQKPEIQEDKLEEMDRTLKHAIELNHEIEVSYFVDGYTKITYGKVKKIDQINRILILDSYVKLNLDDILDLRDVD